MKIIMKLLCVLMLGMSSNAFCENTSDNALALVKEARLDFVAFDALNFSALMKLTDKQARDEMSKCLTAYGSSEFAPVFAIHIAKEMTELEIKEQLDFYITPLGKKTVDATLILAHRDYQMDQDKEIPKFSEQEMQSVHAFLKSATSKKLGRVLTTSAGTEIAALGGKMLSTCTYK